VVLDHLLDLPLDRFEVEGNRVLHRGILDRRQRQLLNELPGLDEVLELATVEVVAIAPGARVGRLAAT